MWGLFSNLIGAETTTTVLRRIENGITWASTSILIICASLVVFYAAWVGFNMAKASDEGKRTQAKTQLIYSIIGIVAIIVLAVMIRAVVPLLATGGTASATQAHANLGLGGLQAIVTAVLNILASCATVFALWLGWNLMSAEDEGKRKNAKMQLMYTIGGIVAVLLINMIATAVIDGLIRGQFNGIAPGTVVP